jgi:Uma2 family endonuclease
MTVAARRIDPEAWTKEQFLAWAKSRPDDRGYEFDGFRPVAMAPATLRHNDIVWNVRGALRDKLPSGTGCRPYGPQQPIETVGGALREPDVFVACSTQPGGAVTISTPVIVFEVLSPGKENRERDEVTKADEYESVPSILRYIVVDAERRGARVLWREPGEREWRREPPDAEGPIDLPEFGIMISFDEVYSGIAFD